MIRGAPPMQSRGRASGFTLLEVVMVLAIVGILAVFALPRLSATTNPITLSAVSAKVAASVRYAQNLSMSQGQRYRVVFTANTVQITDSGGAPIVQPLTASTAAVSVAPATLSGYNPPLTSNYVAFDTKGVPYINATTALTGTATITVTSGSDSTTVAIAPETGRVK
jgi:prepilin-type N-terminal cleavage/methylation domain-containing protein